MAQLVVGGPKYRTATERFRYRLDVLLSLRDIELALEEALGQVWYMVMCAECDDLTRSFGTDAERHTWVTRHVAETAHAVVTFEEPRKRE